MSRLRSGPRRALVLSVLTVLALLGGSSVATAAPSHPTGPGDGNRTLEVDVTNSPTDLNGRPTIAVNPRNPNNLVFTATVFGSAVAASAPCFVAYSMDRGQTWTHVPWPLGDRPFCGESQVAVDSHGTFYLDMNQLGCPPGNPGPEFVCDLANHTAVSTSTDGGATWSAPVQTPLTVAANAHLEVDLRTGKLYAEGATSFLWPGGISVSSDRGQTWTPSVPAIPNPAPCTPPAPGFGCGTDPYIAVYDGILATAYEDPARGLLFNVSTNDGQTFTTLPVTDSSGTPVPPGGASSVLFNFPEPLIAADPTHPGRFAVAIPRGTPNTFQVYITSDAGRTWDGPTVIQAPLAFHPAMAFGTQGWLGVMWRAGTSPAGGENVFAAVSLNHGRSFSPPVQVNAVTEPIHNAGQPPGDTGASGIDLANGNVYVVWSDGRNGVAPYTDAIFARVPIHEFQAAQ